MKIDLEPTWTEILNMVKSGHIDIKYTDLEKACRVADIVRKAQKDGKEFVKFVFEGGEVLVEYDDIDSELDEQLLEDENNDYVEMAQEEWDDDLDEPLDLEDSDWIGDMGAN